MSDPVDRSALALELFDVLVELDAATRDARLAALSPDDPALADEVRRMLDADARASGLLDRDPPAGAAVLAAVGSRESGAAGAEGRTLGPFTLRRLLGRGGMGEVWLAERADGDFRHQVALKLLKRGMDSDDMMRRFVQERRILADLSHPGIARFIDGGVAEDGAPWYAMEFVEGVALTEHARSRALGVRERVALVADVAEAVAYAQTRLVVHRDLKPSNIQVDAEGRVHLLDFGIAKLLQGDSDARETMTGVRAMSPAYAAPEQILGEAISTATDVYALGVVLYELLTGTLPHQRSVVSLETLAEHVRHETADRPSMRLRRADAANGEALGIAPGRLHGLARAVSGELDTIVLTALRREPARRYASAAAFADDLRRWLGGHPVAAQADTAGYRLRKFVARHRLAVGSAVAVLLALVAGFGTALWQARVAREAARRADAEASSSARIANFAIAMVREQYAYGRASATPRTPQEMIAANVESARLTLKDDDRARATLLNKLGELQSAIDSPVKAEPAVLEALQIRQRILGDDHPDTAEAKVSLATVREQGDQLVEAEALLREVLPVFAKAKDYDRHLVMSRSRLASILRRTGRVYEAVEQLEAARAGAVLAYGPDHANTVELIGNRSMLLDQLDRLPEAEAGFRDTIAAYERASGRDFPRLVGPLASLGLLLARTGRYEEARGLFERALDLGRRTVGAADLLVTRIGIDQVEFLRTLGEVDAAEQALASIDAGTLVARPVHNSRYLRVRGQLLADRGQHAEALAGFARAGEALQGAKGDLAEAALAVDLATADVLIAAARWDDCAAAARRSRERVEAQPRTRSGARIELARIEARLAAQAGRWPDAVAIQEQALAQLESSTGTDATLEFARIESDLADALAHIPGREDDARARRDAARQRLAALGAAPTWAKR